MLAWNCKQDTGILQAKGKTQQLSQKSFNIKSFIIWDLRRHYIMQSLIKGNGGFGLRLLTAGSNGLCLEQHEISGQQMIIFF